MIAASEARAEPAARQDPALAAARRALVGEVLGLDRAGLRARLRAGHDVDPQQLAGWVYRGTSLGLPGWVDRLAWKTFAKAFLAEGPVVRGWNVRLAQGTPEVLPLERRGAPWTFGHFQVTGLGAEGRAPQALEAGVLLDYGLGRHAALDPLGCLRDPLVALLPGDPTLLLGWSYLALGPLRAGTPSYFLLERHAPLDHVA
ncbi:MAG: hypothetical protein AB7N76_28670 [Planctomycetota bacterium]